MSAQRFAEALLGRYPGLDVHAADLAVALEAAEAIQLPPGAPLCREGDPATHLWWIVEGTVRVQRADGTPLGEVQAPGVIGHMGLIDRARRSADCAAGPQGARLLSVDRARFRACIRRTDAAGAALRGILLTLLTRQLTEANGRLRQMGGGTAERDGGLRAILGAR